MSFHSNLFTKALSTLAKQQPDKSVSLTATGASSVPSSVKGKKRDSPGTSYRFLRVFNVFNRSLATLAKFLDGPGSDLVARARDVVANPVMVELSKEDPQGSTEYHDAVKHQVVATFQRLRLQLFVLDKLMEAYMASE
jgi:hypothetical protein